MHTSRIHSLWQERAVLRRFRTAVSLHSHTMHSEETLRLLPRYVRRIPVVRSVFRALEERYRAVTGRPFDYGCAFWTPPLPAQEALSLERGQIEGVLGLAPLVSLTDHNNIVANTRLQVLGRARGIPVSLEWTIPLGTSFLHLGLHNLPPGRTHFWMRELAGFTRRPSAALLSQLLGGLDDSDETLVVLNHPLWDEPGIGAPAHFRMVRGFLHDHGRWIHALEMNGLRPSAENQAAVHLARALGYPVISGGDRHGSVPNALLNLTNASSFSDFVAEIRQGHRSEILVTPQYYGPHALRWAECALDIVREYPELTGRRRWMDRAFYREADGSVVPLSTYWEADAVSPSTWLLSMSRLFDSRPLRSAVRAALAAYQASPS